MAYVKAPIPSEVYHLTKKENLDSILEDGLVCCFNDTECWFCESLDKMKAYMKQTVMCEGKPYYAVGGQLCYYPKFVPEDYVLLSLVPHWEEDNWYRWNQEVPAGSPDELIEAARQFSELKIGYRGDLCFDEAEVIDVPSWLKGEYVARTEIVKDVAWNQLFDKVNHEIGNYYPSIRKLNSKEWMDRAEEIAVTELCRRELMERGNTMSRKEILCLLEAEQPLELLRDAWIDHHMGDIFQSVLDELCDEAEMSKAKNITPKNVKELLEAFPHSRFQITTPSCFAELTPFAAKKLLRGETVIIPSEMGECPITVKSEELLELEIETSVQNENGGWYVRAETPTPQMDASEQGFQMSM